MTMPDSRSVAHPYIPNSTTRAKEEMMREIGIEDITSLYSQIPPELKLDRPLQLPEPCRSEFELRRHVTTLLEKNKSTSEYLSFLGSGCYQHYVPAVCDEINSRNEFLTSYSGKAYEDHGRWQALFEYTSLMGELLNMDVVNLPTYDGLQAAATAVRMAANITGRNEIVIAKCIHPDLF
jgi:glycine dehydrogenase subunit 1